VLQVALALGTAFGPLAAGAVFDHSGSYAPFLMLTVVLMAASALTLYTLGPAPAVAGQTQAAAAVVD
jgi:cyanate permease